MTRPRLLMMAVLASPIPAAMAQDPAPRADIPVASTPSKTTKVSDLANRYRLAERYAGPDEREGPGLIGAYRVGIVEVIRDTVDQPQGAPRRSESTRRSIFVERPAEQVGIGGGIVSGTVRVFEGFRLRPEEPNRTMGPKPLDAMSVYYRPKVGELPTVLSLVEGRKLTDFEYEALSRQMFVPQLAGLLPAQPVRLGDAWRVPRRAAQAMLGDSGVQGDTLVGRFSELRKEDDGPRLVATITISGRVPSQSGESAVNAEALFTFVRPEEAPRPGSPEPKSAGEVIEARGAITELRLARSGAGPLPGPGRLRYQSSREITMHRQLGPLPGPPLALPRIAANPTPDDPAALLTLIEPSGRFALDHPQDLLPSERAALAPASTGKAVLGRSRRDGVDLLQVEFSPKPLTPDDLKARLAAEYGKAKLEILKGEEEWLPEADWPGWKVYRVDAAAKLPERGQAQGSNGSRIHFDGYLLLPGQSAAVVAIATTSRDAVAPYRREIEQVLKTLRIDPPASR